MIRRLLASFVVLGLALSASLGQDAKKETKTETKKETVSPTVKSPVKSPASLPGDKEPVPGDVEVHFLNGSTIRMLIQTEKIEIATPYGRLAVPVRDIRGIEFGLHMPDGVAGRIEKAVANLGSVEYRERTGAVAVLAELGPYSYPAVLDASRSKDLETSRRAKEVLKQLQARHTKKDLKTSEDDKVLTPTFPIVGRILTPSIKAKTELFGDVDLAIAKMRNLRAVAGPGRAVELAIDAAKYANAGQWLETDFHVDGRTALQITAKGLVDTWPQQPGQYMVGPGGIQAGRNAAAIMLGGGGGRIIAGPAANQMYGGMLMGKIGDNGDTFVIGDRYEGTPEAEGKLFLHIGPSPWNCQSTGAYDVKIGRKE